MSIQKVSWNRSGSQINIGFDLEKINEQQRVVVGYATVDNIDFSGDIVTAEASEKAFSRFRGNIRFQHDRNRPVGKLLGFEMSKVVDPETGEEHQAIKVAVRISEGAEDIWKMCIDGTLSGFSIGGATTKSRHVYREDLERTVKVIDEYTLTELSIVDSPANGLANIINVFKSIDSVVSLEKSMDTLSLFWCSDDRIAIKEKAVHQKCPICSDNMANIGNINQDDDISKILNEILDINEQKGDTIVSDNTIIEKDNGEIEVDEVAEGSNEQPSVEETEVEQEASQEVEPEAETQEPGDDEVTKSLQQMRDDVERSNNSLQEEIAKMGEIINKKFDELESRYQVIEESTKDLAKKFDSYADDLIKQREKMDEIISSSAMRKSLDEVISPSNEDEGSQENVFAGVFSGKYTA